MKDQFNLITQIPKPKVRGIGRLNVDRKGLAVFCADKNTVVVGMHRTRLESAAVDGLLLSGMELDGYDQHGVAKYKYQEWFLVYVD